MLKLNIINAYHSSKAKILNNLRSQINRALRVWTRTALSSVSDGAGSRYTSVHSQRVEGFHPYADGMGGFF